MPATATYSPTGDPYVDGVLSGIKWAVNSFTFSFPIDPTFYGSSYGSGEPSSNFKAFTAVQQTAVQSVLQMYSAVANVTFTQVTETSTVHGDLRYAESDLPSTAWAYYPSTSDVGGDAWFNNSTHWYDSPAKGNYAFLTMIHETGHTMGLKHPHEASGSFGTMPVDKDSLEYSVMSYHSYVGSPLTGYTNGSGSYPQTLMMYDIAGLQTLYGANYTTNAGDTVYKWDPATGQMSINGIGQGAPIADKIFMTVWDGGGNDTYDFSNYTTSVTVNLQPGSWTTTSSAQLADLGSGHIAVGNIANALLHNNNPASLIENAVGSSGADSITGNAANNQLTGGGGNDILDGVSGTDTAVYSGLQSNYSVVHNADLSWTVTDLRAGSPDGTDTLKNIEQLQFSDKTVPIGTPSNIPPVASNDSYTTHAGTALTITAAAGVLANDTDANSDPLSAILVGGQPTGGALSLNHDGSFIFTPKAGFSGTTSFSYEANDGSLNSNVAKVSINVAPNVAPVALSDVYTTTKNTKLVVTTPGVLANDSDANGDSLSAILVRGPKNGHLTLSANGSFVFTPNNKFVGTTSFTYKDSDGAKTSAPVKVTITVTKTATVSTTNLHGNTIDLSNDQVPPPVLHHNSATVFDPDQFLVQAGGSLATGTVSVDQIEQLLAQFSDDQNPFGPAMAGFHSQVDVAGLPDFLHAFYSEFTLAA